MDQWVIVVNNHLISNCWETIRERIASVSLSPEFLESVLKSAGAPTTPEEIHLSRQFYDTALLRCREIRNRFTFLDLAAASGELAQMAALI
jgi:glycerol-1-phosphate dehydrogenase [NAD(P)+]